MKSIETVRNFFILLAFVNFPSFLVHGQKSHMIDSLENEYHRAKTDSTKARILLEMGITAYRSDHNLARQMNDRLLQFTEGKNPKYYALGLRMRGTLQLLDGNYIASEQTYNSALKIFKALGDKVREANLYENLGTLYGRKEEIERSNNYYLKAIQLLDSIGNLKGQVNSYLNLGINSNRDSRYEESNTYYIRALEIADTYENKDEQTHILHSIGNNYLELKQYHKAEKYQLQALSIAKAIGSDFSLAKINNSLGYLYEYRDKDYKKALEFYERAIFHNKKVNNKQSLVTAYFNSGLQNLYLQRLKESEKHLIKGLTLSDSIGYNWGKIIGNLHLALLSIKKDNIKNTKEYLRKVEVLTKDQDASIYRNNYLDIAKALKDKGYFKEAYFSLEMYSKLTDSFNLENDMTKIVEIESKYENEKKEREILELKNESILQELVLEKEQKLKWYVLTGLIIVSLILLFLWMLFISKKRNLKIITEQKNEIEKQNRIISDFQETFNHDIFNSLKKIDFFINISKRELIDKKAIKALDELQSRISSINEIHRQLIGKWSSSRVNMHSYIGNIINHIQKFDDFQNIYFQNNVVSDIELDYRSAQCLGLIVSEFANNSTKHAFNKNQKGNVTIEMIKIFERYEFKLRDNGHGFLNNTNNEEDSSFGLKGMEIMAEQLEGSFELDGKNGTRIKIVFPIHE